VAANGLDALSILEGDIRGFYVRNAGRESLFFIIIALIQIFTKSYVAMYLASAIVGIGTVIANYFVSRKIWGIKIAALSSFLLATNFYHLHYSRLGYRTILMPLIILGATFVIWRLQKTDWSRKWSIGLGVIMGIGAYTYLSFRTLLLAVILTLFWAVFINKKNRKKILKTLGIATITGLTVAIPLFVEYAQNPGFISGRSGEVVETSSLFENIIKTASTLGWGGDPEFQYNIPGRPIINPLLGIFFGIGVISMLQKIYNSGGKNLTYLFMLLAFGSQLGIIAVTDRVPHMLRSVGITGVMFIIIALGMRSSWRWLNDVRPEIFAKLRYFWLIVLGSLLIFITGFNSYDYFVNWANQENLTRSEFFTDYIALGEYLNDEEGFNIYEKEKDVYIVSTYYRDGEPELNYYQMQTTDYILEAPNNPPYELLYYDWLGTEPGIYFLNVADTRSEEKFLELNPNAELINTLRNPYEDDVEIYRVYRVEESKSNS
jgi:hypothetical protein